MFLSKLVKLLPSKDTAIGVSVITGIGIAVAGLANLGVTRINSHRQEYFMENYKLDSDIVGCKKAGVPKIKPKTFKELFFAQPFKDYEVSVACDDGIRTFNYIVTSNSRQISYNPSKALGMTATPTVVEKSMDQVANEGLVKKLVSVSKDTAMTRRVVDSLLRL